MRVMRYVADEEFEPLKQCPRLDSQILVDGGMISGSLIQTYYQSTSF